MADLPLQTTSPRNLRPMVEQWLLSPLPTGASVTPEQISLLWASAEADLQARFPCIGSNPLEELSYADAMAYAEALGLSMAVRLLTSPAGQAWSRYLSRVEQGTVVQSYEGTTTTKTPDSLLSSQADMALSRITCIRAARASLSASYGTLTRTGRHCPPCTCLTRHPCATRRSGCGC
jgi:hypothetical protein